VVTNQAGSHTFLFCFLHLGTTTQTSFKLTKTIREFVGAPDLLCPNPGFSGEVACVLVGLKAIRVAMLTKSKRVAN